MYIICIIVYYYIHVILYYHPLTKMAIWSSMIFYHFHDSKYLGKMNSVYTLKEHFWVRGTMMHNVC